MPPDIDAECILYFNEDQTAQWKNMRTNKQADGKYVW